MNVLVTGSTGFLGRAVVEKLLDDGHEVRAMVRPAAKLDQISWRDRVELFRADLRTHPALVEAFENIDVVIHLAAVVSGSDEEQFAGTAVGTERLIDAMSQSKCCRLLLASTMSVYDWSQAGRRLDEQTPLESRLYARDGYAIAKSWQERLVRRAANENGWQLTVLRPGFLWGRGAEWVDGAGIRIGRFCLINGPLRPLPLSHVDNCADCVAYCAEQKNAIGQTFNVVDDDTVRAWRFVRDFAQRGGQPCVRIPIPYWLGLATAYLAQCTSRMLFGKKAKLPGILTPIRHRARFPSVRFPNEKLKQHLNWEPRYTYQDCLNRTYGDSATDSSLPPSSGGLEDRVAIPSHHRNGNEREFQHGAAGADGSARARK